MLKFLLTLGAATVVIALAVMVIMAPKYSPPVQATMGEGFTPPARYLRIEPGTTVWLFRKNTWASYVIYVTEGEMKVLNQAGEELYVTLQSQGTYLLGIEIEAPSTDQYYAYEGGHIRLFVSGPNPNGIVTVEAPGYDWLTTKLSAE